jgi:hypothetical protein
VLNFFGLTPSYRPILHKEIHEIIFYGRGGYDWNTVYNFPIWLRRFYFKCISDSYKEEKDAQKKVNEKSQKKKVSKPSIGQ